MRHAAWQSFAAAHTADLFSAALSAIQGAMGLGPSEYTCLMTESMYSAPAPPSRQRDHRRILSVPSGPILPSEILLSSVFRSSFTEPDRKTSPRQSSLSKSFAPQESLHTAGIPNISASFTTAPQPSYRLGKSRRSALASLATASL